MELKENLKCSQYNYGPVYLCDHVVEEEVKVSWIQLGLPESDFCECAYVD